MLGCSSPYPPQHTHALHQPRVDNSRELRANGWGRVRCVCVLEGDDRERVRGSGPSALFKAVTFQRICLHTHTKTHTHTHTHTQKPFADSHMKRHTP